MPGVKILLTNSHIMLSFCAHHEVWVHDYHDEHDDEKQAHGTEVYEPSEHQLFSVLFVVILEPDDISYRQINRCSGCHDVAPYLPAHVIIYADHKDLGNSVCDRNEGKDSLSVVDRNCKAAVDYT